MKAIKFMAIAAAALFAFACTEPEVVDSLTVVSTEIQVSDEGAEQPLSFSTNAAWTLESDQTWVTFDKASGEAGDATVLVTVAANDTYEPRTATLTLKAGTKTTTFSVKQGFATEFASEVVYEIDAAAQTIEFAVVANLEYSVEIDETATWISYTPSKAAPAESKIVLNVSSNTEVTPREGKVYVKAGNNVQCLVVKQAAEFAVMTEPQVVFLGTTMDVYDNVNYVVLKYDEYALTFATEDGTVTLALNYAELEDALAGLPEGEFVVDAAANHAENTFSIKKTDNSEKYYTTVVKNSAEILVEDGEVVVALNEDGTYTITAVLVDGLENQHRYAYVGDLGEIEDLSNSAELSGPTFRNQYNTYFSSKANEWGMSMYINPEVEGLVENEVYCISMTLFGETEVADYQNLNAGTYTVVESSKYIESAYKAGINDVKPYNAYISLYGVNGQWGEVTPGGTVTVSQNEDGTYNFAFDMTVSYYEYDVDYNTVELGQKQVVAEYKNCILPEVGDSGVRPCLDGDTVLNSTFSPSWVGMYYGDVFNTGGALYTMGFTSVNSNYVVYLTLNQPTPYVYEKNFSGRYCNTPFDEGEYKFSATPKAGELQILPVNRGKTCYSYVQNNYTGTLMPVCGGSVTIQNGTITYNLEVKAGDNVYKVTGGHEATLYYARDYSANPSITLREE